MTVQAMPNLTASDGTTAQAGIGDTYYDGEGNKWVYCLATAANIAQYAACSGPTPGAVEAATTTTVTALGTAGGFACVPQFAVLASEYFWGLVETPQGVDWRGNAHRIIAENANAGAALYSTANAGSVDDAVTSLLANASLMATVSTQAATQFKTTGKPLSWIR